MGVIAVTACGDDLQEEFARYELGDAVVQVRVDSAQEIDINTSVTFSLEVENVSSDAVTFEPGAHDFWLLDANDGVVWTSAAFRGGGAEPEITLGSGEVVTVSRTWEAVEGALRVETGNQVPIGTYNLVGQLIVLPRQTGHPQNGIPQFLVSNRVSVEVVD